MALPKAVQHQIDEANRIVAELHGPKPDDNKPDAGSAANDTDPQPEGQQEQEPEGQQAEQEQEPEGQQEPSAGEPKWEQRYRVLKGKYDKEVPRLARELQHAQGQINGLQQLLANLQNAAKQPQQSAFSGNGQQARTLIKPEEIEEYGDEFLDLVGRRSQEVVSPMLDGVMAKLNKIEQQMGGVSSEVVQSKKDKTISQLATAVPNWEELNEDEEFLAWLDMPDPYSGVQRGKLLNQAFEGGNAQRVIAFFQGFLNEHAAVQRVPDSSAEDGRKPRVSLDKLVAPGKPKAGTAGAQQEKRIWTQAEIGAFYNDVTRGVFRSKPDEKDAIEREIIAAGAEGRVR